MLGSRAALEDNASDNNDAGDDNFIHLEIQQTDGTVRNLKFEVIGDDHSSEVRDKVVFVGMHVSTGSLTNERTPVTNKGLEQC